MTAAAAAMTGEEPRGRHAGLIAMLAFVVMFEGFDLNLTSIILPYAAKAFGVGPADLGAALSFIALGAICAYLTLRLADRFGRKPVLILSSVGFSIGTLLTALAPGLASFTAIQFVTRLLLVTQVASAYTIVSETLPAAVRGKANGVLGACASVGAALPAMLLAPLLETALGWRGLFLVGAMPLLIVPLLIRFVREPAVFVADHAGGKRGGPVAELRRLLQPDLRIRFVGMSLLWFALNFFAGAATYFFTYHVIDERGWAARDIALIAPFGLAAAAGGYLLAGFCMDRIGRRPTALAFVTLCALSAALIYGAPGWWPVAAGWVLMQGAMGLWIVGFTINAELFPTGIRATANGWCHNLIGRWGLVVAPLLVGQVARMTGSTGAACLLLSMVVLIAIPAVLILPETRGRSLAEA
ncbi:MFS transporter [Rhizorhabdus wittichii]|uniref:MFS transporter n=1 Tax=Rhizorhabdus wittichii TaxID=160791 RepID=A0A975CXV9_9SPHN|nr:MFS transporter [Rhizorhabdus wittichii]QTH19402.1 MFS transporter [Rhizorhabdus wittichii]